MKILPPYKKILWTKIPWVSQSTEIVNTTQVNANEALKKYYSYTIDEVLEKIRKNKGIEGDEIYNMLFESEYEEIPGLKQELRYKDIFYMLYNNERNNWNLLENKKILTKIINSFLEFTKDTNSINDDDDYNKNYIRKITFNWYYNKLRTLYSI